MGSRRVPTTSTKRALNDMIMSAMKGTISGACLTGVLLTGGTRRGAVATRTAAGSLDFNGLTPGIKFMGNWRDLGRDWQDTKRKHRKEPRRSEPRSAVLIGPVEKDQLDYIERELIPLLNTAAARKHIKGYEHISVKCIDNDLLKGISFFRLGMSSDTDRYTALSTYNLTPEDLIRVRANLDEKKSTVVEWEGQVL